MPNSFKACCLTLFHVKTGQCCPPPSLEECSSLELNDLIFFFFLLIFLRLDLDDHV